MRSRGQVGFTLVELMMVVAVISVATVVAWPTLSSFMDKNADAGAATSVSRLINRVRDQAQRRNRAYLLRFSGFSGNAPGGQVGVVEGNGTSCSRLSDRPDDGRVLETVPFGQTPQGDYNGHVEKKVGLLAWSPPGVDGLRQDALDLCVGPDGSTQWLQAGGVPQPIGGQVEMRFQHFTLENGNWAREGPARTVQVTFAGGAQMGVN